MKEALDLIATVSHMLAWLVAAPVAGWRGYKFLFLDGSEVDFQVAALLGIFCLHATSIIESNLKKHGGKDAT